MQLTEQQIRDLLAILGGPAQASLGVGLARGEGEGAPPQELAGLPQEALAELDRYAQGYLSQQGKSPVGKLLGIPANALLGASSEAVKGTGLNNLLAGVAGEPQFASDPTTSPASLRNVIRLIQGSAAAAGEDLPPLLRGLVQ